MRTDASWTNRESGKINANPFCWATAESLSTVSATTDSCGAGEAVASKVEQEKGRDRMRWC